MAKRFEKKNTDKKEIKKEENKVVIGKAIVTVVGTLFSLALLIFPKGKSGGTKA